MIQEEDEEQDEEEEEEVEEVQVGAGDPEADEGFFDKPSVSPVCMEASGSVHMVA